MPSYYRTIFEIRSQSHDGSLSPTGMALLGLLEQELKNWVFPYFSDHRDVLDNPGSQASGRSWISTAGELNVSGGGIDELGHGHFWLRWALGGDGVADGRYLGFRLATEGDYVQADVEVKVADRDAGHFDDELSKVIDTLLGTYACSMLGLNLRTEHRDVNADEVGSFWDYLASVERCLPVVLVTPRRDDGVVAVDADDLQRDLLGLAEVVFCDDAAAWRLGWYSWPLVCYDGGVRIYSPGLSVEDDEIKHRLWSFDEVERFGYDAFAQILRDSCSYRIRYPQGRDALRMFSRVRGRVRRGRFVQISTEMSYWLDQYDEDIKAKNEEVQRERELRSDLETENARLGSENHRLRMRLDAIQQGTAGMEQVDYASSEKALDTIRTVADAVAEATAFRFVKVFGAVVKSGKSMTAVDAKAFYNALAGLDECGRQMSVGSLGVSLESWMHSQGIDYASGESERTMKEYGKTRHFVDDDGREWRMPEHIRIGRKRRMHLCWDTESGCWLVGYFGPHLRLAGQ